MALGMLFVGILVIVFGLTTYFNAQIAEPTGTKTVDSDCTSCNISSCNLHPIHKEG